MGKNKKTYLETLQHEISECQGPKDDAKNFQGGKNRPREIWESPRLWWSP